MRKKTNKSDSKKDIVSAIEEKFKRHTGVLSEQMRKEVKTVAEGHDTIIRKLDGHDKRFDKVESEVNSMKMAVVDNSRGLDRVENKVDNVDNRLKTVEHKLDKNLDNHEKRITKLEEKVHA